jgi:hypothetical protein
MVIRHHTCSKRPLGGRRAINSRIKNSDGYYLGIEREQAAGWLADDRIA